MKIPVYVLYIVTVLLLTRDVASKACSDKCGTPYGTGTCQSDGKCLCHWGWTGPRSSYLSSGQIEFMKVQVRDKDGRLYETPCLFVYILSLSDKTAEHCQWACHYTHVYKNPNCTDDDDGNCSGNDSDASDEEDI
eukprot:gene13465-4343_t